MESCNIAFHVFEFVSEYLNCKSGKSTEYLMCHQNLTTNESQGSFVVACFQEDQTIVLTNGFQLLNIVFGKLSKVGQSSFVIAQLVYIVYGFASDTMTMFLLRV